MSFRGETNTMRVKRLLILLGFTLILADSAFATEPDWRGDAELKERHINQG